MSQAHWAGHKKAKRRPICDGKFSLGFSLQPAGSPLLSLVAYFHVLYDVSQFLRNVILYCEEISGETALFLGTVCPANRGRRSPEVLSVSVPHLQHQLKFCTCVLLLPSAFVLNA